MSEVAQEKREWVGSYRDIQTGNGYLRIVAPDGMVWESAGTISDIPPEHQPICRQQGDLIIAINALPKMEELIEAAECIVDLAAKGARTPSLTPGEILIALGDVERCIQAIKELRTAIGGKSEKKTTS